VAGSRLMALELRVIDVETEPITQVDAIRRPELQPTDCIRQVIVDTGAGAKLIVVVMGELEALAQKGVDITVIRQKHRPLGTVSDARTRIHPVHARKAVAEQEVGIIQLEGAAVLVGDLAGVAAIRSTHDLEHWFQYLREGWTWADERIAPGEGGL